MTSDDGAGRIVTIDSGKRTVTIREHGQDRQLPFASAEAFAAASEGWLCVGWDVKYAYSFTWLGRPIIQLPEDLLRVQELIYRIQPDLVIETGVAHGGSLVFYASLCEAMGRGRVIGVDIEIRPDNRKAIEDHRMARRISLLEGNSIAPGTLARIGEMVAPDQKVVVILDSNHSREHVLAELRAYSTFVSLGSYVIACDGFMKAVVGAPRTSPDWSWNNPLTAIRDFLAENDAYVMEEPAWLFNEGLVRDRVTHWPNAYLRRAKRTLTPAQRA